jgi:transposase
MIGDKLLMSQKERQRKVILEFVKEGKLTLNEASKRLQVSYRQAKRIYKKYRQEGDRGLVHSSRGKESNSSFENDFKEKVLTLYQEKYFGFGPTFAAEKLAEEDKCFLSHETLRQWLKQKGLWQNVRKRNRYRKKRERRKQFGELLQLDGSFHRWFGEDQSETCLMNMVDDATGKTLSLMAEEETTEAAMKILLNWVKRYGVPKSLYVDLKSVYVSPKTLKHKNEPNEITAAFTHFSRVCDKLGIEIIKAYSPQAKGRVERKHGVFQDRFVKELKLKGIKSIEEANKYLDKIFLKTLNKKFAVEPLDPSDAHRDYKAFGDLNNIFCWEYERTVQNDWTVSFKNKYLQIEKRMPLIVRPKHRIIVHEHLNKKLSLWYKGEKLNYREINFREKAPAKKKLGQDPILQSKNGKKNKHKSPWSQFNPDWLKEGKRSAIRT